ncbi:hypothetical protein F4803DRAFT_577441 [Xylaria telfairii]|nr:hypothetical protein F4803DRAFT_577441 [Xylaria telfairii]
MDTMDPAIPAVQSAQLPVMEPRPTTSIGWRTSKLKTRDGFEWQMPKMMGAPYSRAFLEAFYEETETDKNKREQEQARYGAAFPDTMREEPNQAKGANLGDDTDVDTEIPGRWTDHSGALVPLEHSNFEDSFEVWKRLFGTNSWPEGCLPFEIPVPEDIDPQVVLAAPNDLSDLMFNLWERFSPAYPWCFTSTGQPVRTSEMCRGYGTCTTQQSVSLGGTISCSGEEQIHILEEIDAQDEWELQQHHKLVDIIRIRLDAIARRTSYGIGTWIGKSLPSYFGKETQDTALRTLPVDTILGKDCVSLRDIRVDQGREFLDFEDCRAHGNRTTQGGGFYAIYNQLERYEGEHGQYYLVKDLTRLPSTIFRVAEERTGIPWPEMVISCLD